MVKSLQVDQSSWLSVLAPGALLAGLVATWFARINAEVPDPYLDEIFHVRQAQVYCSGKFRTWDPKITTPPGLYLVSWLIYCVSGRCSINDLRALNVFTVVFGWGYAYSVLRRLGKHTSSTCSSIAAANIWLFPPLFFFSGLYYTDVQSAFWVLLAFQSYLKNERHGFKSWSDGYSQLKFGFIALLFRQTNIFWVAIFPAGLALISSAQNASSQNKKPSNIDQGFFEVWKRSWNKLVLYNPNVHNASIEDYVKAATSLAIVSIGNWKKTVLVLIPYMLLVALFAFFVYKNGGVVLGDKSNHVATLHLPQMLYLWPYMLFFSWPLVTQAIVCRKISLPPRNGLAKQIALFTTITAFAMAAIHFNTIIHPFTLADNRHYVFYVFRILMRHPAIKYLAAPTYVISGYLIVQTGNYKAGFLFVWLITTALSLITAPLVEPRYCILPWMMWRLNLGDQVVKKSEKSEKGKPKSGGDGKYTLIVETVWFLVVFAGTAYMFLEKPFTWPQEPGKLQRFMW